MYYSAWIHLKIIKKRVIKATQFKNYVIIMVTHTEWYFCRTEWYFRNFVFTFSSALYTFSDHSTGQHVEKQHGYSMSNIFTVW